MLVLLGHNHPSRRYLGKAGVVYKITPACPKAAPPLLNPKLSKNLFNLSGDVPEISLFSGLPHPALTDGQRVSLKAICPSRQCDFEELFTSAVSLRYGSNYKHMFR